LEDQVDIEKISKAFRYLVACGVAIGVAGVALCWMQRSSLVISVAMLVFCTAGTVSAVAVGPLVPMQKSGSARFESVGWLMLTSAWVCLLWSADWTIHKAFIPFLINVAMGASCLAFAKHMAITASAYLNWLDTSKDI
jgi:hypothetical protein